MASRKRKSGGDYATSRERHRGSSRDAMTLIELLVVVTIASLLLAASIPLMRPAVRESRLRDASRQLNTFLVGAQARAIEIGRPVGVWIDRLAPPNNNGATTLYLAETPPFYTGDSLTATATISSVTPPASFANPNPQPVYFAVFVNSESLATPIDPTAPDFGLVNLNETFRVKFDYRGTFYPCTRIIQNGSPVFVLASVVRTSPTLVLDHSLARNNPPALGVLVPFQVLLNPRRSSAAPLALPRGTVIDLEYSGVGGVAGSGSQGREFIRSSTDDTSPVVIVFRPSGDIERLSYALSPQPANGTVHLLVGSFEEIGQPSEDLPNPIPTSPTDNTPFTYGANIADGASLWVSIGHRNGVVTSSPNGWSLSNTFVQSFRLAREFAQSAQSVGGG